MARMGATQRARRRARHSRATELNATSGIGFSSYREDARAVVGFAAPAVELAIFESPLARVGLLGRRLGECSRTIVTTSRALAGRKKSRRENRFSRRPWLLDPGL